MKNFTKLLAICMVSGLFFISCKNDKKEEKKPETTEEKVEVKKTPTVLNANLATEDDLKNLGLSEDLVSQIIAKRPFLKVNDLDALLPADSKEEIYKGLFVPMNLNTTPEKEFKMIPGVGDKMAHEFEEYRPYTSVAQFKKEIGKYVDQDQVAYYLNYVFVPVELNTASEEDIKALPGVGNKMAHEFEEYRPYKNMAQFRKEISKYVDDKELSRLERLVYLNE